jgi:hypothetical protein
MNAALGPLRTAAGDAAFHAGLYIRGCLLMSAVLVGLLIVRRHSAMATAAQVASAESDGWICAELRQ